ncbi:hypothetical protein GCM10010495_14450 [Kitasatospora herbaricolor]|nr:hypothetical protein GCM10010495_14450 [Kitasatospora herbaricolor]
MQLLLERRHAPESRTWRDGSPRIKRQAGTAEGNSEEIPNPPATPSRATRLHNRGAGKRPEERGGREPARTTGKARSTDRTKQDQQDQQDERDERDDGTAPRATGGRPPAREQTDGKPSEYGKAPRGRRRDSARRTSTGTANRC